MKAKRTAPPRRRVSFAVDRDEIEINSDWVDAVMSPVTASAPRDAAPLVPFLAPPPIASPAPDAAEAVFFATDENTATGAESATDEQCTSVENDSAVDKVTPVAQITAVENESSVEQAATVEVSTTVADGATIEDAAANPVSARRTNTSVEQNTTVVHSATDEFISTGERSISTRDHRRPRPRPILRVTDGLTPGQYAVYSLMYQAGEGTGASFRIYKGGYADLGRLTGLSKRGIQNIVAELQAKQVIRIHQQPGYHRSETSAYLVPDPDSVLHTWFGNGWRHALGKSKNLVN